MTDTKHCARAHPHENMSFACSLRAISAQVRCAPETATPEFLSVAADAIDKAAGMLDDFQQTGTATLRDAFAMAAMQGDWAGWERDWGAAMPDDDFQKSARVYYRMADAMLAARNEPKKDE